MSYVLLKGEGKCQESTCPKGEISGGAINPGEMFYIHERRSVIARSTSECLTCQATTAPERGGGICRYESTANWRLRHGVRRRTDDVQPRCSLQQKTRMSTGVELG